MQSIQITLARDGWEKFTGKIGEIAFENGTSVEEVPIGQALRMSATFLVVDSDGNQISPSTHRREYSVSNAPAPMLPNLLSSEVGGQNAVPPAPVDGTKSGGPPQPEKTAFVPESDKDYNRDELEKVADENGIDGLREIAELLGVKGRSIIELIYKILQAQIDRAARSKPQVAVSQPQLAQDESPTVQISQQPPAAA